MRALVYTAERTLEMRDIPIPQPGEGEVRVQVQATGICGSDLLGFLGRQKRRQPGLVFGHEAVGVVESGDPELVGRRVSVNPLVSCGTCRACRAGRQNCCPTWRLLGLDHYHGGFAEHVVVPRRNVHPLPDHVDDATAVMIEPIANGFHLCSLIPRHAGVRPTAVILGGGTLAAATLLAARASGVQILAVTEVNRERAESMRVLGATHVIDPSRAEAVAEVKALSGGEGVDVVFDCVGKSVTRLNGLDMLARGGTALFLGTEDNETNLPFGDLIRREIGVQTSYAYNETDFATAFDFVVEGGANTAAFTEIVPMEEGQGAFDRLVSGPGGCLKIALRP